MNNFYVSGSDRLLHKLDYNSVAAIVSSTVPFTTALTSIAVCHTLDFVVVADGGSTLKLLSTADGTIGDEISSQVAA